MSSPQLPVPLPPSGSVITDALLWLAPIVTALGAWFASQFTAVAKLEKTLLDASRLMVAETQATHARDGVHISNLQDRSGELEAEVIRLRGLIRQHQQWEESVRRWAARSALHLPEPKHTEETST